MEDIKDSNLVNLATSIDAIQRKLATPKKRGVRVSLGDEAKLDDDLRNDMVSIITSPLSQMWKLEPIPGLSAAQVEALRALYASVRDESNLGEGLEAVLEAAVKLLNPIFTPRIKEETATDQDGNGDSTSGPSMPFMPVRRSTRLAKLPEISYREDEDKEDADELEYLLDGAEMGSDGEEEDDEDDNELQ